LRRLRRAVQHALATADAQFPTSTGVTGAAGSANGFDLTQSYAARTNFRGLKLWLSNWSSAEIDAPSQFSSAGSVLI